MLAVSSKITQLKTLPSPSFLLKFVNLDFEIHLPLILKTLLNIYI